MAATSKFVEAVVRGSSVVSGEPTSKRIYNVFHFQRASVVAPLNKTQFFNGFNTSVLTPLLAALSVNYSCIAVDVRAIDDPTDPYAINPVATSGAITGDNLPSLNCVVANLNTGLRGRSQHGRKFFALVAESDTLQDALVAGAITRYTAILTAYLAGFTDAGSQVWSPYLVSRKASDFTKPNRIVGNPITTAVLDSILGRMKRRQEPKR